MRTPVVRKLSNPLTAKSYSSNYFVNSKTSPTTSSVDSHYLWLVEPLIGTIKDAHALTEISLLCYKGLLVLSR